MSGGEDRAEEAMAVLLARPDTQVVGRVGDVVVAVADAQAVWAQCLAVELAAVRERMRHLYRQRRTT